MGITELSLPLRCMVKRNNSIELLWCIKIAFSARWILPDQSCQPKYAPSKLKVNAKIDELNICKEGMLNFGAYSSHIFSFLAAKFWQGRNFESQLLSKHHLSYSNNLPSHFLGFEFYFIFRFTLLLWRSSGFKLKIKASKYLHTLFPHKIL